MNRLSAALALILMTGTAFAATELAKVNGKPITDQDLTTALAGNYNEGQRATILKDSSSRRQVLNNVIDREIVVQEAQKEKLDQQADYKAAMNAFRDQYLYTEILQKYLKDKLTDKAVKKYYETHQSKFSTDQVHAQHILVSDEQQARDIMKKAAEKGADFQALAEKYSKDPSAKNNRGDLGFFGRDRMVPEFTEAAFSGNNGELVGPVKTAYGYHIIKVIEKRPGKTLDFAVAEPRVRQLLQNDLVEKYVSALREQAKVQVDDKAVDHL